MLTIFIKSPGGGEQATENLNGEVNGADTKEEAVVVAAETENGSQEHDAG